MIGGLTSDFKAGFAGNTGAGNTGSLYKAPPFEL